MRVIFLTRGPDELRSPLVSKIESLMNPDVNHVSLHTIRYSDFENNREPKAAVASLRKAFKIALRSSHKHILVDTPAPGQQSWMSFAAALDDVPNAFVVGIDPEDEKMIFKTDKGSIFYQNVTEEMIEDILTKHHVYRK